MTAPPANQLICQRCRRAVAVTRVKTMRGLIQHACQACADKRHVPGFARKTIH